MGSFINSCVACCLDCSPSLEPAALTLLSVVHKFPLSVSLGSALLCLPVIFRRALGGRKLSQVYIFPAQRPQPERASLSPSVKPESGNWRWSVPFPGSFTPMDGTFWDCPWLLGMVSYSNPSDWHGKGTVPRRQPGEGKQGRTSAEVHFKLPSLGKGTRLLSWDSGAQYLMLAFLFRILRFCRRFRMATE